MANAHKDQLASRHARLDANLAAELKRPVPDTAVVRRLKSQKLKLKDELSAIQLH
ncbi:YdcH family protein [Sandarakinorhabdus sp.]|uniref:YdcH family protein n=1 Tax=Sandarakinorhabdus sp. TaxID=1916663 RepID=UPI0033401C29